MPEGLMPVNQFAIAAVQQNGNALRYVNPNLINDANFVLAAVQNNGRDGRVPPAPVDTIQPADQVSKI